MKTTACQVLMLVAVLLLLTFHTRIVQAVPALPESSGTTNTVALTSKWHTIKITPPSGLPKIHWYKKINPLWWFKDIDDPLPPAWYRPSRKTRRLTWSLRNPFHNFNFYVIGVADRKFTRSSRYPEVTSNPHGGWNFAVSKYKRLQLPFVSYRRGRLETYFGWRDRGNFGIKFNIRKRAASCVSMSGRIGATR
jgi:hypothetical protein